MFYLTQLITYSDILLGYICLWSDDLYGWNISKVR